LKAVNDADGAQDETKSTKKDTQAAGNDKEEDINASLYTHMYVSKYMHISM
jgi:hypothetical protein